MNPFHIVKAYADFGHHRSGTPNDHATANGFASLFNDIDDNYNDENTDDDFSDDNNDNNDNDDFDNTVNMATSQQAVDFDFYDTTSELLSNDTAIDHLPLTHAFHGTINTTNIAVQLIDPDYTTFPATTEAAVTQAKANGHEALVLATDHPNGELVAQNYNPTTPTYDFPVVLVAGRDYSKLKEHPLQLVLNAQTVIGTTMNVQATNNQASISPALMFTTPLTGWFQAAGERGTGIAVTYALAKRFSHLPLIVVGTGGHEVGFLGAHHWTKTYQEGHNPSLRAIVHIGASVAVPDANRFAMTSLNAAAAKPLEQALAKDGFPLRCSETNWGGGEGEVFQRLIAPDLTAPNHTVPMLSLTGEGIDFHTPADTPERVTSPEALELAAQSIGDATEELLTDLN